MVEFSDPGGPAALAALELYRLSFSSPAEPPYTHIDTLTQRGFYRLLGMFDEEGVVVACGYVIELSSSGVYHLDYFCVNPNCRGGGIGTKFFNGAVEFLKRDGKYPFLTLECDTKLVSYYTKLRCVNPRVQSDSYEDHTYYLMYAPLSKNGNDDDSKGDVEKFEKTLERMVCDLKGVLRLASVFAQMESQEGEGEGEGDDAQVVPSLFPME